MNNQKRYTLVRVFNKKEDTIFGKRTRISTEEISCKTLKEALDLWSCLNEEEKILGSYVVDTVNNKTVLLATNREIEFLEDLNMKITN